MKTIMNRLYCLQMTDNRKTILMKKILTKLSSLLIGMESTKFKNADILVIFSFTGEIVNKNLFTKVQKFQKLNKKCYVYSDYSNTMREVIRIEKSEKDFETNSMFGCIIHAGMKIETYNQLLKLTNVTTTEVPQY